jgi:hypothetical protein
MNRDMVWRRGSPVSHLVRVVLYAAILVGLLVGGLLLLEGGGSSPARPLGGRNISNVQLRDGTSSTTDNPNKGCKPNQPPFPHDCRPPSGG